MKTISSQLAAHLGQDNTTTAMLWKLKRQDGVILGFTDHDQPITFNDGTEGSPVGTLAVTYLPYDGATASATETGSDMSSSSQELVGYLDSAAITESDIFANKYDYTTIEIRLVNWNDLTMGALLWKKGTLGEVKMKNGQFTAEIRGLEFYLNTNIGDTYGAMCRADLGDSKCTFNVAAAAQTGVVVSVSDLRTFVPAAYPLTSPANPLVQAINGSTTPAPSKWFNEGVITWLTGLNAGYKMECGDFDGTNIVLFENMPYTIQAGDTFTIEPGCDHSVNTCNSKFNNLVNFRGEPFIPGNQQIMVYPNADGTVPST
jgi:hypothetical protein